ncbi:hypothetical protein BH10BAC4_BH10BAC4_09220 [soil metagenome]
MLAVEFLSHSTKVKRLANNTLLAKFNSTHFMNLEFRICFIAIVGSRAFVTKLI